MNLQVDVKSSLSAGLEVRSYNGFRVSAFVLMLLASYLQNFINVPGIGRIPAPLAFVAALLIAPLLLSRISAKVLIHFAVISVSAVLFGFFSIAATGHFPEVVMSSLQLLYIYCICYILYLCIDRVESEALRRISIWLLLAICAISVVEMFTPLRGLFDQFRLDYYGKDRMYAADLRDIQEHGGLVRPKVFSSEPSYLALYGGLLVLASIVTSTSARGRAVSLVLLSLLAVLVRSPSLVGPAAAVGAFYLFILSSASWRSTYNVKASELGLLAAAVIAALLLVLMILAFGIGEVGGRIEAILNGTDRSFLQRIVVPVSVAVRVFELSPLFGAGIGGNEAIQQIILLEFAANLTTYYYSYNSLIGAVGSTFIAHWTYFGVVGGIAILLMYVSMSRAMVGSNTLFFWCCVVPVSFVIGGYSFHSWVAFFAIAGLARKAAANQTDQ